MSLLSSNEAWRHTECDPCLPHSDFSNLFMDTSLKNVQPAKHSVGFRAQHTLREIHHLDMLIVVMKLQAVFEDILYIN